MVISPQTMLGTAALLVAVFVLGFWLRRSGKPYSGLVMTVHKLASLAVLILFILVVYRVNQATPLGTSALLAVVLTIVVFLTAIISGGLVSIDRPTSSIARALHWAMPFLTIAGVAATFILLKWT